MGRAGRRSRRAESFLCLSARLENGRLQEDEGWGWAGDGIPTLGVCQLLGQEAPPCKGASSRHRCVGEWGPWGERRNGAPLGHPGASPSLVRLVGRALLRLQVGDPLAWGGAGQEVSPGGLAEKEGVSLGCRKPVGGLGLREDGRGNPCPLPGVTWGPGMDHLLPLLALRGIGMGTPFPPTWTVFRYSSSPQEDP